MSDGSAGRGGDVARAGARGFIGAQRVAMLQRQLWRCAHARPTVDQVCEADCFCFSCFFFCVFCFAPFRCLLDPFSPASGHAVIRPDARDGSRTWRIVGVLRRCRAVAREVEGCGLRQHRDDRGGAHPSASTRSSRHGRPLEEGDRALVAKLGRCAHTKLCATA